MTSPARRAAAVSLLVSLLVVLLVVLAGPPGGVGASAASPAPSPAGTSGRVWLPGVPEGPPRHGLLPPKRAQHDTHRDPRGRGPRRG